MEELGYTVAATEAQQFKTDEAIFATIRRRGYLAMGLCAAAAWRVVARATTRVAERIAFREVADLEWRGGAAQPQRRPFPAYDD